MYWIQHSNIGEVEGRTPARCVCEKFEVRFLMYVSVPRHRGLDRIEPLCVSMIEPSKCEQF